MVQARLNTWKYKSDHDTKHLVLQTEFKYINNLQDQYLHRRDWSRIQDPTTIVAYISSDSPRPVGPVHPTGRTGRHHAANSTGQTGSTDRSDRSTQNRKAAHSAHKCTTRQRPILRVPLLDLPPLCIPADELDTTGAEIDVWVSWNNNCGNKPWVY